MVVAGPSDAGKTFFIGSAATSDKSSIIIDMDDGTDAFGIQYDEALDEEYPGIFPEKDIRVIDIDMDTLLEPKDNKIKTKNAGFSTSLINGMLNLKRSIAQLEEALKEGLQLSVVGFETASWLWMGAQDWMKYRVLEMDDDAKNYVNQTFDWSIAQKEYRRIFMRIKKLRRYGCNVIMTVHTKNTYNKKMEITGSEIHWWKQSIKLCDTIIWIKTTRKTSGKKILTRRIAEFHRLRGVENAKKISKPIEDITWKKLMTELSRIRLVAKEKEQDEKSTSKYTVDKSDDKSDDKPAKKKRKRVIVRED